MDLNREMAKILDIIHLLEDPAAYDAYVKAEMARRRARTAARNARFARMLEATTDIQAARIDGFETSGYKAVKVWQSRSNGRVAVMLQKDGVWDEIKMKMGTKLIMVYHDGRNQAAFGKVPLHNDWI